MKEPHLTNDLYMQDVLRDHWGFNEDGRWVTGDCGAVANIFDPHNYTTDYVQASAAALRAGTDIDCGSTYNKYLPQALNQSLISRDDLEKAVTRQYSSLVRCVVSACFLFRRELTHISGSAISTLPISSRIASSDGKMSVHGRPRISPTSPSWRASFSSRTTAPYRSRIPSRPLLLSVHGRMRPLRCREITRVLHRS